MRHVLVASLPILILTLATAPALGQNEETPSTVTLPRATGTSPVRALVECYFGYGIACEIAEHCELASDGNWRLSEGVPLEDYGWQRSLEEGHVVWTPLRANGRQLCRVAALHGILIVSTFRYFRHREGNAWAPAYSATSQFASLVAAAPPREEAPLAPSNAYRFYQLVKGRKMCFDGCGAGAEYIYFKVQDEHQSIERVSFPEFTLYRPDGGLTGLWGYEVIDREAGSLTLDFDHTANYDECALTLGFDTETSGTVTMVCRDAGREDGTWEILDRP